jgi:hypothetical protein
MAGVPTATLQGWAIPLVNMRRGEHTYVTSTCGLKWGCWGRDSGGSGLSAASGSSTVADCLSQPNSEAGIIYGITGLCHQTANRILHPAKVTVAGCQGYNVSAFAFGAYGLGVWTKLPACYPPGTFLAPTPIAARPFRSSNGRNLSSMIGFYNLAVSTGRTTSGAEEGTQLAELSAMIEMALGHPIDGETLRALRAIQAELWRSGSELVRRLHGGELDPDQYLDQLHASIAGAMSQSRSLLGEQRFEIIFGDAGKNPEELINRTIFMERTIADA